MSDTLMTEYVLRWRDKAAPAAATLADIPESEPTEDVLVSPDESLEDALDTFFDEHDAYTDYSLTQQQVAYYDLYLKSTGEHLGRYAVTVETLVNYDVSLIQ